MLDIPYLPNGFLDIEAVKDMTKSTPFVIIIGIRQGAGKTYGLTQSFVYNNNHPVIVRRTKQEREKFGNKQLTPLQKVPAAKNIIGVNEKDNTVLYYPDEAGNPDFNNLFGWVFDLGAVSKRGFNITGFDTVFFDECVPERHAGGKRDMENASTFYNFLITLLGNDYMTIDNHPKIWMVGNSDALVNGIFTAFGVTDKVERMIRTGRNVYISPQRCISILLVDAPENARKRSTMPIMRVAAKSATLDMALNNKFGYDDTGIAHKNLREFQALAAFKGEYGSYTVWRHKRRYRTYLYVTKGAYPAKYEMPNTQEAFNGLARDTSFKSRRDFWYLCLHAISGRTIYYDSLQSKDWFQKMLKN